MNNQQFCFIICYNDDLYLEECLLYISNLIIPDGFTIDILTIKDAKSITSGYNEAMKASDAKYKIYLHQDTLIVNKNIMSDLLKLFSDSSVGLVGVIGCKNLPVSGVWWDGLRTYGRVLHACEPESVVDSVCRQPVGEYEEVEACDGLFLASQYSIPWREDLFTGFHLYDTSYCLETKKAGLKTVIPNQTDAFWCIHCPKEKPLDPIYKKYQRVFINEYSNMLSPEV